MRKVTMTMMVALLLMTTVLATAQNTKLKEIWVQDFETNTDGWLSYESDLAVTNEATTGIAPFSGSSYMQIGPGFGSFPGAFHRFDGYRDVWPGTWVAEIAVYIDIDIDSGTGFEYSVAANGTDGNHQRDYIFHCWKLSDGNFYVAGTNNSDFSVNEGKMKGITNKYVVPASGWYVLRHTFYDNGGALAVDLELINPQGTSVFLETREPGKDDIIPDAVGGNRYGWFTFVNATKSKAVEPLYVDKSRLLLTTEYFELLYQTNGAGSLTGATYQEVFINDDADTVTAVEPASHSFVNWIDGDSNVVGTDLALDVTNVTKDETYTAVFAQNSYTVNFQTNGNGSLTGDTSQNILHGNDGTAVTAVDADLFSFVNWTNSADTVVGTDPTYTPTGVTGPETYTANFQRNTGDVLVVLEPAAGSGWRFLGDTGDYFDSGNAAFDVPTGTYQLELLAPDGYETPDPVTITVTTDQVVRVTVILQEVAAEADQGDALQIIIAVADSPGANSSGGFPEGFDPQWRIISGPGVTSLSPAASQWYGSGDSIIGLQPGTYTIEFSHIPGFLKPGLRTIVVEPGQAVSLVAIYPRPFIAANHDYDGDGVVDVPTRFSNGKRLMVASGLGYSGSLSDLIVNKALGTATDVYAPGDYDGDGVADLAYYRPNNGVYRVPGVLRLANFGSADAIPVPGDYDGDGADDPAVYDAIAGTWKIYFHATGETVTLSIGGKREVPVPANWDGDANGTIEPATWNVNNYKWNVFTYRKATDSWRRYGKASLFFGQSGDYPVAADYDGDGKADHVVYRNSTNQFIANDTSVLKTVTLGQDGDMPMAADWLGTGKSIPTVFRPSTGEWITPKDVFEMIFGAGWTPMLSTTIF